VKDEAKLAFQEERPYLGVDSKQFEKRKCVRGRSGKVKSGNWGGGGRWTGQGSEGWNTQCSKISWADVEELGAGGRTGGE